MKTLLFASDLHGSTLVWEKIFRSALALEVDGVFIGGDVSGKALVPIIDLGGSRYSAEVSGTVRSITDQTQLESAKRAIEDVGRYWHVMSADEADTLRADPAAKENLIKRKVLDRFEEWIYRSEVLLKNHPTELYLIFGNDDSYALDDTLKACQSNGCRIQNPEYDSCVFGGAYEVIGLSATNKTPFPGCPRDVDEIDLVHLVDKQVARLRHRKTAIFLFHAPPFDSGLDMATEVRQDARGALRPVYVGGEPHQIPTGSRSIRTAIEIQSPLLTLHGHIHESPGTVKLGTTLCINAGSLHADGALQAFWVSLDGHAIKGFRPILA